MRKRSSVVLPGAALLGLCLLHPLQAEPVDEATYRSLAARAHDQGSVRVIVRLSLPFEPAAAPTSAALDRQRRALGQAQATLLVQLRDEQAVRRYKILPYLALDVGTEDLARLRSSDLVESIFEDLPVPPTLEGSVPKIGADTVHAAGFTGSGQVIAVLDTGLDRAHSFLAGKVLSEACFSTSSPTYGSQSVCPGGQQTQVGAGAGAPCPAGVLGCDHGTHVAGIAAGRGVDSVGVAPDADLIAIQVFSIFPATVCQDFGIAGACALSFTSDQIAGLERVLELRNDFKIAVANLSLGGGKYTAPCPQEPASLAIGMLRGSGVATVISAGNSGYGDSLGSPACIPAAVSIGATDLGDVVAGSSNSAAFLDLLAPGVGIRSAVPGDGFKKKSGTSMAAPHVAGAWAVLRQKSPGASVDQVLDALVTTGDPVVDAKNGVSKPRIRLDGAIDELACGPPSIGDWILVEDCVVIAAMQAPANVSVRNGAVLTIAPQGSLDLNFAQYTLHVEHGSRVLVQKGGKLH